MTEDEYYNAQDEAEARVKEKPLWLIRIATPPAILLILILTMLKIIHNVAKYTAKTTERLFAHEWIWISRQIKDVYGIGKEAT